MTAAAIIGDIHGDVQRLTRVLSDRRLRGRELVFLGDYVNRGPDSAKVLEALVGLQRTLGSHVTFIQGNHDAALLSVLKGGPVVPLLAMGGAATVLSYAPEVVGDVGVCLRETIPGSHQDFLESLVSRWTDGHHIALHAVDRSEAESPSGELKISGHFVQPTLRPARVGQTLYIDTGCGSLPDGRLTTLLVPEVEWFQH
jgi:serine/threonine protein phosphatase 1